MTEDDEQRLREVHEALRSGADLVELARPWGKAKAQEILTAAASDYITELNRSLTSDAARLYGLDASEFMRSYNAIWQARLSIS